MTGKIFINYRRGDDPQAAGRLFDRLQDVFQPEQLFLDVDNIAPGLDFVRVLNQRVAECDVVLAVIGKSWLDTRDESGARRLDDPEDFVRIEITSALNQGKRVVPVLIGDAQMPRADDLPEVLRPLARRNAVRLTHERFRADTQGLVKSLQKALDEIEAERQARAEAARLAEVENERARQEAERRQQEVVTKQRALEEREFAAAKAATTIVALDAFIAAYPGSSFVDEGKKLRAVLSAREEAYQRALASNDPLLLKSFLTTYRKGGDADRVRAQLRSLEPRRTALPLLAIAGAATLAILLAGGVLGWLARPAPPSSQQAAAVPAAPPPQRALTPQTAAVPVLPAEPPAQPATAPASAPQLDTKPASAPLPQSATKPTPVPSALPPPNPDQVAWSRLKDTIDTVALRRFVVEFPDSALRAEAAARLAALQATQTAWNNVKDSKDPDQLQRFIEQYPDSIQRADAEQRIASLTTGPAVAVSTPAAPNPDELARFLQLELKRVGCFTGTVNGEFDDDTQTAWRRFTKLTSLQMPGGATPDALNAVRAITKRVCPPICRRGEHVEGDVCVANESPKRGTPKAKTAREAVSATSPAKPKPAKEAVSATSPTVGSECRGAPYQRGMHPLPGGGCGY